MLLVRDYADLIAGLRERKRHLRLTDIELDEIAKWGAAYWAKIAGGRKTLGPKSLGAILTALSLEIELRPRRIDNNKSIKLVDLQSDGAKNILHERALHANRMRWLKTSPQDKKRQMKKLQAAAAAKHRARWRNRAAAKAAAIPPD